MARPLCVRCSDRWPAATESSHIQDLPHSTLARVIAQTCGYRAVEINASDVRATEMRKAVLRAAECQTPLSIPSHLTPVPRASTKVHRVHWGSPVAFGGGNGEARPNLVVLDEIDGADSKEAISAVVQMIAAPLRKRQKPNKTIPNEDSGAGSDPDDGAIADPRAASRQVSPKEASAPLLRPLTLSPLSLRPPHTIARTSFPGTGSMHMQRPVRSLSAPPSRAV